MMDAEAIIWNFNYQSPLIGELSQDELAILDADIRDAIDCVIEDWTGRE